MAEITAALVAQLRAMTNVGMMECKKALTENNGDLNAAVEYLRKKGIAGAAKLEGREAKEGMIAQYIAPGAKVGVLVEVNCITDFVARNESFVKFGEECARKLAADPKVDLEPDRQVILNAIREKIAIARHQRIEVTGNGLIAAYIHTGAKLGVLVEVGAEKEATIASDAFKDLVKDITLQIAAGHPYVVSREQAPADIVAKEKEIAAEQCKGKPAQAIENIVKGKLEKFFQGYCLVDQGFVKRNGEISVAKHIEEVGKQLGDTITVRRFVRFKVGEVVAA
jgi:elongation factor Ts